MARQLGRSFSFDDDDQERSLSGNAFATTPRSTPHHADFPHQSRGNDPPPTPAHRSNPTSSYNLPPLNTRQKHLNHTTSNRTASTTTPGADNMGEAAVGGGIAGVALGVANTHQRESGLDAVNDAQRDQQPDHLRTERGFNTTGSDTPYIPEPRFRDSYGGDPFESPTPSRRSNPFEDGRRSWSQSPSRPPPREQLSSASMLQDPAAIRGPDHTDNPYNRYSTVWDARVSRADINPDEIDDDGDDMMAPPVPRRRSALGLSSQSRSSLPAAAGTGGFLGALGGLVGRRVTPQSSRDASGQYGPVGGPSMHQSGAEKSEWLSRQTAGRKRLRWIIGILIALAIIGAVVGGAIAATRSKKSNDADDHSTSSVSAAQDDGNGDLDKDSAEIKKLMNNANLHKVFPGMDYTPFGAQYPDCLTYPPSQNNVTRDVAVLSQLTNTIRLYGTDCNQTEMVLHAISKLALPNIKVWLGVWLDGNQSTTDRGLGAMNDILAKNGADPFAGVIIGNEVLYRKDMTIDKLGTILSDAKQNFTKNKIDLPVATSDLGDDWTAQLAEKVDVVMSNIHPFFAGVPVEEASGWTWTFWQGHDTSLTQGTTKANVISEVGWPSGGGTDCGTDATKCAKGSVAGIDEMNTFMDSFICQSLANATTYFWFEAFDEPWKVRFNTKGKEWEDQWGLMDPGRRLKPGLKIPDCGGKTID